MVKCADCGFMAKRALGSSVPQPYQEIEQEERTIGISTGHYQEPVSTTMPGLGPHFIPRSLREVCFRHQIDLQQGMAAIKAANPGISGLESHKRMMEQEHDCPEWYRYKSGFDPKEHLEELRVKQLEQDRRNFEVKLFEMSKKLSGNFHRVMVWLTIAAIFFAVAQVVAALLGITSDSWILRLFR